MPPTSFARTALEAVTKIKHLVEITDWNDPFTVGVTIERIRSWSRDVEEAAARRIQRTDYEASRLAAIRLVDAIPVPLPRCES